MCFSHSDKNQHRLSMNNNVFCDLLKNRYFGFGMGITTENHEYTYSGDVDMYMLTEGIREMGGDFYSGNLDYKHNFSKEGHEISGSVQYYGRSGGNESTTKETVTDINFNLSDDISEYRTYQDRSTIGWRFKIDYTLPINEKFKLEAGYQTRIRVAGGDYTYENYIDDQWVVNDTFTNELIFDRNIHSLYTSLSGKIFGIGYMAGIRGEYTNRLIDQLTTGESYPVKRFDFFPSLHLTKELPKSQQLQLSYSRRIERPRHWYLNPFPGFEDAYSVRVGNPGLLPEYIDSYDLSYQKRIKQSFVNVEAYFRQKNNNISRIQQLQDDGKLLMTFENIDKEFSFGTELSGNIMIKKWWTLYVNANFYRYNVEGEVAGVTTDLKSINYDFRLNTTFMFSKTSRLQLSGFYNGPTVTVQGEREEMWFAGAAFRQEFFKRKLSMVINVRDIFKTGKYHFTASGEGFITENEMRREAPVISLSLSYKINNYKQKRGERDEDMNDMDDGGMM
jgi:outer membrane receptor protein involved in Fe transport